ncbi:MAG: tyrosine-type recombinase/integrase [Eubacteriales bacterium]|nr:tyrosine-type recombinase/integrase [Eubacteriales bacterium]
MGPPKTTNSMREIPLPDLLVNLAQLLKNHEENYVLSGTNKCMEPRIIQRKYAALLKECEIPPIKIHSLRHQFSCRWVEQGFDTKSLSEILGHTSVRTTLDLYVHIREDTKRNYMNQLIDIHK